ncbi:YbhB/YbcL family Raf kinase inhibitor-like protein [Actinoallomurus iriomotensis]|uniref:YbhB/YbcL family Raf kinase inhibitor-like protein n=1 Tax=Actinoallomurus iriomotensis TaxID=478107 RepID=UPI002554BC55|nr:YbhB/YbcL family Raf kinase inhibitor-like protein [Actinoallomurus iriomotensis]
MHTRSSGEPKQDCFPRIRTYGSRDIREIHDIRRPRRRRRAPEGAFQRPNDARVACFIGAAPPAGHGSHRYFVVVHAPDVESKGRPLFQPRPVAHDDSAA